MPLFAFAPAPLRSALFVLRARFRLPRRPLRFAFASRLGRYGSPAQLPLTHQSLAPSLSVILSEARSSLTEQSKDPYGNDTQSVAEVFNSVKTAFAQAATNFAIKSSVFSV